MGFSGPHAAPPVRDSLAQKTAQNRPRKPGPGTGSKIEQPYHGNDGKLVKKWKNQNSGVIHTAAMVKLSSGLPIRSLCRQKHCHRNIDPKIEPEG